MLSIIIVIAIVLLSIVLAGIGIYVGMHNSDEKEESKIDANNNATDTEEQIDGTEQE